MIKKTRIKKSTKPKKQQDISALERKTFEEHYSELKSRIIFSLISFLVSTTICFIFSEKIYDFLVLPLKHAFLDYHDRKFIFTGLAEGLSTYFKLSLYSGFLCSFPFIVTQIYLFIAPGLYRNEKRVFLSYCIASTMLFICGIAMVYFLVMPAAWKFFLSFEKLGFGFGLPILLEPRISEYLDLILGMIFGFGIAFQLPIILITMINFELLEVVSLIKFRRYAIVLIFIIAAILTPPDVFSQIALALPLLLLYEISIILGRLMQKKKVSNVGHKINQG